MTEDRRQDGFYFTGKQFMSLLGAILSVQIGVNWYAAKTWVHETAVEVLKQHNVDPEAHARALMVAQQERMEQTKQIVILQTKIDGLEQTMRSLVNQLTYQPNGNGNGRH